jgi:cholest-4-en-3-one 26-monooxygenase
MHALMTNPDQWQRFSPTRSDDEHHHRGGAPLATPVLHFRRTAMRDYDLGGVRSRRATRSMWHISANRDERHFADPFRFDIGREDNDHVASAVAVHFCLGANLARMEMRLMFREMADRLADMRLTDEPKYLRSNFIGGIKHMPVALTPTASTGTGPMARLGAAAKGDTRGYGHQA